jgi:oligopeptide transport system ATP-binding protein
VRFAIPEGYVLAVNDLSFELSKGECLGVVGESGSGKTQTFMALLGLLAANGQAKGSVKYNNKNLLNLPVKDLNKIRGNRITMVFQDALTGLTPHMRVGKQLTEVLREHLGKTQAEAETRVIEILELVRIPAAKRCMRMYAHELSGGMRQRIMIAMALLCEPDILIADEPTTALDVTVQAEILRIFDRLKRHTNTAIVLITHDLGVIAGICDRVLVMYGGRIVESGGVDHIFYDPQHPYTCGLLDCMPRLDGTSTHALPAIPGQPPNLQELTLGCAFEPRCKYAEDICRKKQPSLKLNGDGHSKACYREEIL